MRAFIRKWIYKEMIKSMHFQCCVKKPRIAVEIPDKIRVCDLKVGLRGDPSWCVQVLLWDPVCAGSGQRLNMQSPRFHSNNAAGTKQILSFRCKKGVSLLLPALKKGHKNAFKFCDLLWEEGKWECPSCIFSFPKCQ